MPHSRLTLMDKAYITIAILILTIAVIGEVFLHNH